ncbi:IPT/TIG domain-containing protein [Arthrobacter humicola]|uniref:IPT/TIG domain-containing protein n=1 Tax=Arthrobacter humicola TaxID=409291 RepID=UPI001FAD85D0|nr:IPT/TIG domain-containing protein [Arthrobacter humicola]MCI9870540.1 IPT/TIG domain-containing protein [Arthrobacter humicola]
MSDFSRSPLELLLESLNKGYVGIHIEQGVPILDRDLNLLQDLLAAGVRSLFSRYIGNGLAFGEDGSGEDGFAIRALPAGQNSNDFQITGPGSCLAGGIEATVEATTTYDNQPSRPDGRHVPKLSTPTAAQPDPRIDTVYLDVLLTEVDETTDTALANSEDVGMQTSVRLKPEWSVLVAEGGQVPAPTKGHVHYPLAELRRRRGEDAITSGTLDLEGTKAEKITDLRQRKLTLSHLETRLSLLEKVLIAPTFAQNTPLQPLTGQIHQEVTLTGNNFDKGGIKVFFDSVPATVAATFSSNQIKVLVPGGLTPNGTGRTVRITVANEVASAVCDKPFRVRAVPAFVAPPNAQFSPASGSAGTEVVLSGFNFNASDLTVFFEGQPAPVVGQATNNSVKVQVPDGLATGAAVAIKVNTREGSVQSDDQFRVENPPPSLTGFTPPVVAVGGTVTLRGQNLDVPPVRVEFTVEGFAPVRAGLTDPATPTQIKAEVPDLTFGAEGQRQARIKVTTGSGSDVSAGLITITRT